MNDAEYSRGIRKKNDNIGNTTDTMINWWLLDSGCSKFGVTPGGGGAAGLIAPSVELISAATKGMME
jgi:hypothetical protein